MKNRHPPWGPGVGSLPLPFLALLQGVLCCLLLLLLLPSVVEARYLRFEPGYEYQYKYRSKARVHRVDTFTVEARVGYTCIQQLAEGQEIKLNVIALTLESGKAKGVAGHSWDLSKWFSFVLTPRGDVLHVKHGSQEDEEAMSIKKGLAALLAARLHHHSDQDDVTIVQSGQDWRYDVQEVGHEGPHNATYLATPTPQGVTFTKIRHEHPVPHAVSSYQKKMHYHEDLGTVHTVEIQEQFDVMSDPPHGYDPYIKGQQRPDKEEEQPVFPSMTGEGRGTLSFLTKIHVAEVQSLVPPDVAMVTTSIHVSTVTKRTEGGRRRR